MTRMSAYGSLATILVCLSTISAAQAQFKIPGCTEILNWAASGASADDINRNVRPFRDGNWLLSGMKDEQWVPMFGVRFPDTTPEQLAAIQEKAEPCRLQARGQLRQMPQRDPRRTIIGLADSYMILIFRGGPQHRPAFLQFMARQKANYQLVATASSVRDTQLEEMQRLQPSLESIARLEEMKKEPQLAGLGSERAQYIQRLDQHALQLADAMVTAVTAEVQTFPETLDGMRDLMAYRVRTVNELGRMRSRNWQNFNNAYASKLDEIAVAALPEFVAVTKAEPPTDESRKKLDGAIAALFPHQPLPRNIREFRRAVSQRLGAIDVEMKEIACNDTLTTHGLTKDANTPLMGPDGASTLGSFVCGMPERGHRFTSYKKPGWMGNTYELVMLAPQGFSVTLEMKLVEVAKGQPKMLVGTRVKDATTTEDLNMTDWQALVTRLADLGGTGGGPSMEVMLSLIQSQLNEKPAGCVTTIYTENVRSFPVTVEANRLNTDSIRHFEALRNLGLFEVSVSQRPPPPQGTGMKVHTYTLTDKAKPFFRNKEGLCFATQQAEDVTDISKPFERGGRTIVTGKLIYSASVPEFALDPSFAQAMPGDVQRLINVVKSGQDMTGQVAFLRTDSGWQLAQ